MDLGLRPDEASGEDRHVEARHHPDNGRQDDPGQDLDDVRGRAADRGDRRVQLTSPDEEQPVDRGHAAVADRRHELAVRADHRIDAGPAQPLNARPVRPEAADEVDVDRDQLVRGVDLTDEMAQREAVAAQQEENRSAAGERLVEALIAGDRRAARIGCHALDEGGGLGRGVGHGGLPWGTPGA